MTSEDRFVSKPRADTRWRPASVLTIACLGAFALWRNGMTLGKLRLVEADVREETVERP